jgi:Ca2+:H+ antiporter
MILSSIVVVVASIEETAVRYHIPKAFIGVVLLPIVVCFTFYAISPWLAHIVRL